MGSFLDLESWERLDAYRFFLPYDLPFFNICTELHVGATRAWCRTHNASFSSACWFLAQRACNALAPCRYRLRPQGVWVHDRVEVATTFLQPDGSFRFAYIPYNTTFDAFAHASRALAAEPRQDGMDDQPENDAVIHGSTLPWVRFTSVTHPRRLGGLDSVPKIVFGKAHGAPGDETMAVSVEVHHALMDGVHVAQLLEHLQELFTQPETNLAPTARC